MNWVSDKTVYMKFCIYEDNAVWINTSHVSAVGKNKEDGSAMVHLLNGKTIKLDGVDPDDVINRICGK